MWAHSIKNTPPFRHLIALFHSIIPCASIRNTSYFTIGIHGTKASELANPNLKLSHTLRWWLRSSTPPALVPALALSLSQPLSACTSIVVGVCNIWRCVIICPSGSTVDTNGDLPYTRFKPFVPPAEASLKLRPAPCNFHFMYLHFLP